MLTWFPFFLWKETEKSIFTKTQYRNQDFLEGRQFVIEVNQGLITDLESAGYYFFAWDKYKVSKGSFSREISTWARHFLPLNFPERSEGQFRGLKMLRPR